MHSEIKSAYHRNLLTQESPGLPGWLEQCALIPLLDRVAWVMQPVNTLLTATARSLINAVDCPDPEVLTEPLPVKLVNRLEANIVSNISRSCSRVVRQPGLTGCELINYGCLLMLGGAPLIGTGVLGTITESAFDFTYHFARVPFGKEREVIVVSDKSTDPERLSEIELCQQFQPVNGVISTVTGQTFSFDAFVPRTVSSSTDSAARLLAEPIKALGVWQGEGLLNNVTRAFVQEMEAGKFTRCFFNFNTVGPSHWYCFTSAQILSDDCDTKTEIETEKYSSDNNDCHWFKTSRPFLELQNAENPIKMGVALALHTSQNSSFPVGSDFCNTWNEDDASILLAAKTEAATHIRVRFGDSSILNPCKDNTEDFFAAHNRPIALNYLNNDPALTNQPPLNETCARLQQAAPFTDPPAPAKANAVAAAFGATLCVLGAGCLVIYFGKRYYNQLLNPDQPNDLELGIRQTVVRNKAKATDKEQLIPTSSETSV